MPEASTTIAAIDAGSNGIKMLIGEIDENGTLWEIEEDRESIRLGHDAFTTGRFSEATIKAAVGAFERFKKLADAQGVKRIRAVATSACRQAKNSDELAQAVRKATGIKLEVIDGLEEAQLVFAAVARKIYLRDKTALLFDMGGGSVEVTVAVNGRAVGCETLELGPVRIMEKLNAEKLDEADTLKVIKKYEGAVAHLIETELDGKAPDICIGTGGSIETLGHLRTVLCDKANPAKFKPADLDVIIEKLLTMKPDKRAKRLGLKADRADVIAIAAIVMRMLVREAKVARVLIPDVGLRQGLLHQLADRVR